MLYSELNIPEQLHKAVERMGFVEMTEVQEKAIPVMLEGRDIIAKAPTGTGKTCAFGIPLILGLEQDKVYPQAVVLAPTRELAQQITEDLKDLAHFYPDVRIVCVYGGANIQKQIEKLKKGAHIIVATPGRFQDHINRRTVDISHIRDVVLDEADEMLNMGFYKDVRKILDQLKARKRLAMFSATISREVMDIGWLYQRDAEEITVQPVEDSAPKIDQYMLLTTGRNKLPDITSIILKNHYQRVMIFCNTKYTTAMLANQLADLNFSVDCLHGDLSQAERNKIMATFREGNLAVLVATDVAARGIDVSEVDAVINYDVPPSNEYYTHRIGRTGRAKHVGTSYLLYTKEERTRVRDMLRYTRNTATPIAIDDNGEIVPAEF
ncbi:MAG TPA: DEAD/DEAH box helicase [Candidatus Ruthenibacterium merdigallinarum]|nr:DEAD/DEAH box helicase [Candidatus Ruthenibacterium merdigallinarum]